MSDEQEGAEAIDEDVVDIEDVEAGLPASYPPDRPLGVDDVGALDVLDDLRSRVAREEPEWPRRRRADTSELSAEEAAMHEIEP